MGDEHEDDAPLHKLSEEDLDLCRKVFDQHAAKGDNRQLDTFDLRAALQEALQTSVCSEEELVAIIRQYDKHGNGTLSWEDFVTIVWQQKVAAQRQVSADIDTIDAFVAMGGNPDKSGSIVAKRLIDACKEFKLTIDIEELIAETDQDGSGFIDVQYDEFSLMLND